MNEPTDDLIIEGIEFETDAVFTTDKFGAFNVSRILRYAIRHGQRHLARLNIAHSMACLLNCDLDMHHISRLMQLSDEELTSRTFLLYIDAGDGTHICIDGNHRFAETCRRARDRGEEWVDVPSLTVTLEQADQFRIRYYKLDAAGNQTEIPSAEMLSIISGCYSDDDGTIRDMRRGVAA